MSLKLVKRHGGDVWYLRGSIRGIRVDESTGTRDQKAAEEILINRQAEIQKRSIHGDAVSRTFAEAALGYQRAKGNDPFLGPILRRIGRKVLCDIKQGVIEDCAEKLYPKAGPATQNRKVYTPISAVLHWAARQRWIEKPIIARPKQPQGRVRSVTRTEARLLIASAAPHLRPLVAFLFSTGCRLSEALYLDWRDVDLTEGEATFRNTKNGETRTAPLPPEAVAVLANLTYSKGAVFRTQMGRPYASRNGEGGGQVKRAWATMCKEAGVTDFTPHDCRHTFATWYLRANPKDVLGLMQVGGWKSVAMVKRYAHIDLDDVKPRVQDIWGNDGDRKKQTPRKAKSAKVIPLL